MEPLPVWTLFCDDPLVMRVVISNVSNLKDITTWNYPVPYESQFLYAAVLWRNVIFFTGGGNPMLDKQPEEYLKVTIKATINGSMQVLREKLANMLTARACHSLVLLGDKSLFAVGGLNEHGNLALCEEYVISHNVWRPTASLSCPKRWISVCALANRYLYAFGGAESEKKPKADIEVLDTYKIGAQTWEPFKLDMGTKLWTPRYFVGSLALTDTCILVFGGYANEEMTAESFLFHPSLRSLTPANPLQGPDVFFRSQPVVKSDKAVIVGGQNGNLHIYDKANKKWDISLRNIWNPESGFKLVSYTN